MATIDHIGRLVDPLLGRTGDRLPVAHAATQRRDATRAAATTPWSEETPATGVPTGAADPRRDGYVATP